MRKYAAIILSAGYSSRMNDFKPLMNVCGKTPLERNISLFKNSGIEDIYIVAGYQRKRIKDFVGNEAEVIYNKDFAEGMLSSVKVGISNLPQWIEAFFILPVDIPSIKPNTIKKLIDKYERGNYTVVYPTFSQRRGHPPLISTVIVKDILEYNGLGGLRNILSLYEERSIDVQLADRGVLLDMDVKEDYKTILKYISKYPYPDDLECWEMMRLCGIKKETIAHMKCVGELSKIIAEELNSKGHKVDADLAYRGGLLHDIGKGKNNHAKEGALMINEFGYSCLFEVINEHMNIDELKDIKEKEIVYISDKLIKGTRPVSLEERFRFSFYKYRNYPEIMDNIKRRFYMAKKIKMEIESVLGHGIEQIQEELWKDLYIL
jgi:molybdenum cofactor cytidylyltransferase